MSDETNPPCEAVKQNGEVCRLASVTGSDPPRCTFHQPESDAFRRLASRQPRRPGWDADPEVGVSLDTNDLFGLWAELVKNLRALGQDAQTAREMRQALELAVRLSEMGERRLERLAQFVRDNPGLSLAEVEAAVSNG